jgi:maltooligosyltrehalose trehalohydrolase
MCCVWAPLAGTVELILAGHSLHLIGGRDGWWSAPSVFLEHGQEYAFRIDGKGPFPDPRSPWQPHGPHGQSRWVDHTRFRWTDQHWQARPLAAAVIYELHIGTFTPEGTFDAAITRLDHLVDLGVTHLEVMPVAEFEGKHGWGYDGVSLYAPHHPYGGPEGLKRFVNACHAKGLGVLLDVVYNHLGPTGNYLPEFGPYFTDKHSTPWGAALNYDGPHCEAVRRYFIDNALMWLRDYHFDGLRLDAVHAIVDLSAVHFLEQLSTEVDELKGQLGRHLVLIAESDLNDPQVVRPWELGGFGLDAQWCDDIHHALHTVLTGEQEGYYADFGSIEDLATSMQRPFVYNGRHSQVRQRPHGRPPLGLSGNKFVAFLQNHDQLGNRARGERLCDLAGHDLAKVGAALILLSPYVPMLFQGEEWAASSPFQYFVDFGEEPTLAESVVEGRRREFAAFGWKPEDVPDPTDEATFHRSALNWDERTLPAHASMLEWYRDLIRLRRSLAPLTSGRLDRVAVQFDSEQQWLLVRRNGVLVVCNFAIGPQSIPIKEHPGVLLLTSKAGVSLEPECIVLPGECAAVLGPESSGEQLESFHRRTPVATTKLLADQLSAGLLVNAEEIWLVDPHQVGGQGGPRTEWMELLVDQLPQVPSSVESTPPPIGPLIVEVAVDSTHPDELERVRQRVRSLLPSGQPATA